MGLTKILLLLLMIYLHIVDDYRHQGILAQMKQKSYWEENAPDRMYRYDYVVALFMHSFSWSFMIMLPLAIYNNFDIRMDFLFMIVLNTVCHYIVDDIKANKGKINLIVDQIMHMAQIIVTFIVLMI